jgi:hypothetical protein
MLCFSLVTEVSASVIFWMNPRLLWGQFVFEDFDFDERHGRSSYVISR